MRNSNLNAALCWKMEKLQLLLPTLPRMRILSAQRPGVAAHTTSQQEGRGSIGGCGYETRQGSQRLELPPRIFNENRRANGQAPARDRADLPGLRLFATLESARRLEKEGDDTPAERSTHTKYQNTRSRSTRLRAPGFNSAPPHIIGIEGPRLRALTSSCCRRSGYRGSTCYLILEHSSSVTRHASSRGWRTRT